MGLNKTLLVAILVLMLKFNAAYGQVANESDVFGEQTLQSRNTNWALPKFNHVSVDDGLAHSMATDIVQGPDGYLWVGTQDGLTRYDGYEAEVYRHSPFDSTSITHNLVEVLFVDSKNNLWVGTASGLNRSVGGGKGFEQVLPDDATGIGSRAVISLAEDHNGMLWIGTAVAWDGSNQGLFQYNPLTDELKQYWPDKNGISQYCKDQPTSLLVDSDSFLWIGTGDAFSASSRGGICRFDPESEQFSEYLLPNRPDGVVQGSVRSIFETKDGTIWLGAMGVNGGLFSFDEPGQSFVNQDSLVRACLLASDSAENGTSELNVAFVHEATSIPGTLWVGLYNQGICRISLEDRTSRFIPAGANQTSQLTNATFWSVFEDRQHVLWMSTFEDGLYSFDSSIGYFGHIYHEPDNADGLSHNVVEAIVEDTNGMLWVGTWGGGVDVLEPVNKVAIRKFRNQDRIEASLSSDYISAIIADRSNGIWIGTAYEGGVNHVDQKGNITRYQHNPANVESLSPGWIIMDMVEAESGDIWVGSDNGLDRIEPATGRVLRFSEDLKQFGDLIIRDLCLDSEGVLWIGTSKGLLQYDDRTQRFSEVKLGATTVDSPLNDSPVLVVHASEKEPHILWIGTKYNGLIKFDTRNLKVIENSLHPNPIPAYPISGILEDMTGILWLASNPGPGRYDPHEGTYRLINTDRGLQSRTINKNAWAKGQNGLFYFGGPKGLNIFDPAEINENPVPPELKVTGFRLMEGTGHESAELSVSDNGQHLFLTHSQNGFFIDYTGFHYSNPKEINYSYRLEGLDEVWRDVGSTRTAVFTNLSSGEYKFWLSASNAGKIKSRESNFLTIVIAPPWWQTRSAYFVYLCLLVGSIFAATRLQRRRVVSAEREAARIREAELLAAAADERAQLAEHLDEVKSRFFVNLSHEFRTPLTLILGPLRDALDGAYGQIEGTFQHRLESMQRNGRRLHRLINQLLDLAKLEAGGMHLRARETDLVAFTRILTLSFSSRAERENNTLQFESDVERLPVYIDRDKMERVVLNLLSNAFKFTPAHGKIRVMVRQDAESAVLEVKDTGQGIPAEELPLIFDRFHQADTSATRVHEGSGIGLSLVKELVALHHGSIHVTSDPGFGSTFTVLIPLGKDHLHEEDLYDAAPESNEENWQDEDLDEVVQAIAEVSKAEEGAPTILIVEDNPDVRDYLKSHLLGQYHVIEATDGEEGLQQARAHKPDLVISDVMMPKMDGYALCAALKQDKQTSDIPVVLLTARAAEENKLEGLEVGADDYIYKPFSARELLVRTENLITLRRRLRNRYRGELVLKPTEKTVSSVDAVFLEKVRDVIEARMGDASFGVGELADEMALSRRQLQRRIRELTELTVSGFIRIMRIERAGQLLKQKAGNVSEVAHMVGFRDPRYFAKVFQQLQGKSPKEWGLKS